MGLFDFLKKKEEAVELKEPDLHPFFEKSINQKFAKLNAKIHEISIEVQYNIKKLKEYLDVLESEELRNSNIPERERQIMEGNRENFIKRTRVFANKISIPESYIEIDEACKNFFEDLELLTAETQKSLFVLKDFFEETIKKLTRKIKELEDLFIGIRRLLEKENIELVNEINGLFKKVEDMRIHLADAKSHKKFIESEIEILNSEKEKILKKIHSLESSNDYRFYKGFLKEKEAIEQKLAKQKSELLQDFSEIEKALKKFSKKALDDNIIKQYIDNPSEALMDDEKIEIKNTISKLQEELKKDKLEIKDKKKEKTLEAIKSLTKQALAEKRKMLLQAKKELSENTEKIRKNTTSLQLREQKSYLESTQQSIKDQEKQLAAIENTLESTNPNLVLQKITEKLSELSGNPIKWKR